MECTEWKWCGRDCKRVEWRGVELIGVDCIAFHFFWLGLAGRNGAAGLLGHWHTRLLDYWTNEPLGYDLHLDLGLDLP